MHQTVSEENSAMESSVVKLNIKIDKLMDKFSKDKNTKRKKLNKELITDITEKIKRAKKNFHLI